MPFVRMNSMPLDFPDDEDDNTPAPSSDLDGVIGPLSNVRQVLITKYG